MKTYINSEGEKVQINKLNIMPYSLIKRPKPDMHILDGPENPWKIIMSNDIDDMMYTSYNCKETKSKNDIKDKLIKTMENDPMNIFNYKYQALKHNKDQYTIILFTKKLSLDSYHIILGVMQDIISVYEDSTESILMPFLEELKDDMKYSEVYQKVMKLRDSLIMDVYEFNRIGIIDLDELTEKEEEELFLKERRYNKVRHSISEKLGLGYNHNTIPLLKYIKEMHGDEYVDDYKYDILAFNYPNTPLYQVIMSSLDVLIILRDMYQTSPDSYIKATIGGSEDTISIAKTYKIDVNSKITEMIKDIEVTVNE